MFVEKENVYEWQKIGSGKRADASVDEFSVKYTAGTKVALLSEAYDLD